MSRLTSKKNSVFLLFNIYFEICITVVEVEVLVEVLVEVEVEVLVEVEVEVLVEVEVEVQVDVLVLGVVVVRIVAVFCVVVFLGSVTIISKNFAVFGGLVVDVVLVGYVFTNPLFRVVIFGFSEITPFF
jgi:hypothetical protein